jgi:hypothetical protein
MSSVVQKLLRRLLVLFSSAEPPGPEPGPGYVILGFLFGSLLKGIASRDFDDLFMILSYILDGMHVPFHIFF